MKQQFWIMGIIVSIFAMGMMIGSAIEEYTQESQHITYSLQCVGDDPQRCYSIPVIDITPYIQQEEIDLLH